MINPLPHLPLVGALYRRLTGDEIGGAARSAGGLLYGGPLGMIAGIGSALALETSGEGSWQEPDRQPVERGAWQRLACRGAAGRAQREPLGWRKQAFPLGDPGKRDAAAPKAGRGNLRRNVKSKAWHKDWSEPEPRGAWRSVRRSGPYRRHCPGRPLRRPASAKGGEGIASNISAAAPAQQNIAQHNVAQRTAPQPFGKRDLARISDGSIPATSRARDRAMPRPPEPPTRPLRHAPTWAAAPRQSNAGQSDAGRFGPAWGRASPSRELANELHRPHAGGPGEVPGPGVGENRPSLLPGHTLPGRAFRPSATGT